MVTEVLLDVMFPLRKRVPSGWMVGTIGGNWMGEGVGVGEVGVVVLDTPTGVLNVDNSNDVLPVLKTLVVGMSDDGGRTDVVELTTADGDTLSDRLREVVTNADDSAV